MTMSKYDYKNKKFLEHYTCDTKMAYIEQIKCSEFVVNLFKLLDEDSRS